MRGVRAPRGCRAYFFVFFCLHLRLCAALCEFCCCEGSIQATEAAVATSSSPSLSLVEHTTALVAKHLFL